MILCTHSAMAQQLSQQVEVEHSVSPEHRDFSPLSQTPTVNLPALYIAPLSYSDRYSGVRVTPTASKLEAPAPQDSSWLNRYKGYATLGYWPAYHLDLSAGYRILDTDKTRLSAWGQINGANYTHAGSEHKRTQLAVGADLKQAVGHRSTVDAGLAYRFAAFNSPYSYTGTYESFFGQWNQYVNSVNLLAAWHSSIGEMKYNVRGEYEYFAYAKSLPAAAWYDFTSRAALRPARESVVSLGADAKMPFGEKSAVALGVNFDFLHDGTSAAANYVWDMGGYRLHPDGGYNRALLGLTPTYSLSGSNYSATIGLDVDFAFNSGAAIRLAPEVKGSWAPIELVRVTASATGGSVTNTLSSLFEVNYLNSPMLTYGFSHVPLDFMASVLIGPRKAIYGEIFGGYAIAKDWLMPQLEGSASFFAPQQLSGWHGGVKIGGQYKDWGSAELRFEGAPQSYGHGYYPWRDRAKYVLGFDVTAHPMDKLTVGLGYELRACRAIINEHATLFPEPAYRREFVNLRNVSNLSVNGNYRYNERLTFFLTLNNLLSRHQLLVGGIPAEGFNGLIGLAYKF